MQFLLTMSCDNDAFMESGPDYEVARILRDAAERCEEGHTDAGTLRDVNGNTVGHYRMDEPTFLGDLREALARLRGSDYPPDAGSPWADVERAIDAFGKLDQWMTNAR